jgi:molybdenum-dependent DNA-binding transcriptional regulator ModE
MEKRDDEERKLSEIVEDLVRDIGDDRGRLTDFLDRLIEEYADGRVGIAEYVAKLMDAATRQHQVKATLVKALAKRPVESDSDSDEYSKEIGMPFKEVEDGSN